jgi:hypothetical protein
MKIASSHPASTGRYYCLAIFAAQDVVSWWDGLRIGGFTAVCPHCGIDGVLPDAAGLPVDLDLLEALQPSWCRSVRA